jgi:hypothetical protein
VGNLSKLGKIELGLLMDLEISYSSRAFNLKVGNIKRN